MFLTIDYNLDDDFGDEPEDDEDGFDDEEEDDDEEDDDEEEIETWQVVRPHSR